MKQLKQAMTFRGVPGPPFSTRRLGDRFPAARKSVSALVRQAGPFIPGRDAFHFQNGAEEITLEDARLLREYFQAEVDAVAAIGIEIVRSSLRAYSFSVPLFGATGLPAAAVDYVVNAVTADLRNRILDSIVSSIPGAYGRCGGMAFGAYDFFLAGRTIPRDAVMPQSGPLRDYVWTRLIDSLVLNAGVILKWTMILHILPVISKTASAALGAAAGGIGGPAGAALGALVARGEDVLGLGGADALLGPTREQWTHLKGRLDGSAAWPVGVIFGGESSPTQQHQILATAYRDNGDDTGTLHVWENRHGNWDSVININMQGRELVVSGDSLLVDTKGLICEAYEARVPPAAL